MRWPSSAAACSTRCCSGLAPGLRVEARAPDGVIEAFSKPDAPGFNLAVQWHPEWQAASNPVSMTLLSAFGAACAAYRDHKNR
jgi:putative glutamine amidotransferase